MLGNVGPGSCDLPAVSVVRPGGGLGILFRIPCGPTAINTVSRVSCFVFHKNHWWRLRSRQKKCLTAGETERPYCRRRGASASTASAATTDGKSIVCLAVLMPCRPRRGKKTEGLQYLLPKRRVPPSSQRYFSRCDGSVELLIATASPLSILCSATRRSPSASRAHDSARATFTAAHQAGNRPRTLTS